MLVTVGKLSIEFDENIEGMERKLRELERLEKAIEASPQYKLLSGKKQMIGKGKGEVIKERSRRVHTNGIAKGVVLQAVRKIYDRIQQENSVFIEDKHYRRIFELNRDIAITRGMVMAKAHDIGHVPCGHEGEKAINEFFSSITRKEDIEAVLDEHLRMFGSEYEKEQGHFEEAGNKTELVDELFPPQADKQLSFEHNELSALLLNQIIEEHRIELATGQTDWDAEYDIYHPNNRERKNLTMGVLGHSTSRTPFYLLEGDVVAQIVRVGDKVEYINADYDEIAGLLWGDFTVEQQAYLEKSRMDRMTETVDRLVEEAFAHGRIHEKGPAMSSLKQIRKDYEDLIYLYDGVYADNLLKKLLSMYNNPTELRRFYDQNPGVEVVYPTETLELFVRYREALQHRDKEGSGMTETTLRSMYENILTQQLHFKGVIQGENADRIDLMYAKILQYYYEHQDEIPERITRRIEHIDLMSEDRIDYTLRKGTSPLQRTLEYVSMMDDKTFEDTYEKLVQMRIQNGPGHGIEPINMGETKQFLREEYDKEVEQYRSKISGTGSRTFAESKKLYTDKCRNFFRNKLTPRGKAVVEKHYEERFAEYKRDYDLYTQMQMADAERARQAGEGSVRYPVSQEGVTADKKLPEGTAENDVVKGEVETPKAQPNNSGVADGGTTHGDR